MGFIDLLLKISPALENGQSLEKAETWSNVATATHALVVVFGFILVALKTFHIDIPLSDDQLFQLAGAVASVGGTVSAYLHHATNEKSGIKKRDV